MIRILTNQVEIDNIDQMAVFGKIQDTPVSLSLFNDDMTADHLKTFNAFINFMPNKNFVNIINYNDELQFDRITSSTVVNDTEELDYNTLSDNEKLIVNNFIDMLKSLNV